MLLTYFCNIQIINIFYMTWKHFFTSSIGKKFTMGLTGFFLITFLIVHCAINAMIFFNDGGETFNHWGHFMGANLIIRTMEIGLFAVLFCILFRALFFGDKTGAQGRLNML